MDPKPLEYVTYLLRLWCAGDAGLSVWRAALENPRTGERQVFANLAALCVFLEEKTRSPSVLDEESADQSQQRRASDPI
jgi:hypothetical protein